MGPQKRLRRGAAALLAVLTAFAAAACAQDAGLPAGAPLAFDCAAGCTFDVQPACGEDGEWYHNACLAYCGGGVKTLASTDACDGARASGGPAARCSGAHRRTAARPNWVCAQQHSSQRASSPSLRTSRSSHDT